MGCSQAIPCTGEEQEGGFRGEHTSVLLQHYILE